MQLIQTTPETAWTILDSTNRKIVTNNGNSVMWINLNNETLYSFCKKSNSGLIQDFENVELFVLVPNNAKTIF